MKKILLSLSILFSSHLAIADEKALDAEKKSTMEILVSLKADNSELLAAKAAEKAARSELTPQSHDLQKIKYADAVLQLEAAEKKTKLNLEQLQTMSPSSREKLHTLIDFSKRLLMSKLSKPGEVPPAFPNTQIVAQSDEYLFLQSLSTRLVLIDYSERVNARDSIMNERYRKAIKAPASKQAAIMNGHLSGGGAGEAQDPVNTGADPLEVEN